MESSENAVRAAVARVTRIKPYTAQRIDGSYAAMERVLAPCIGLGSRDAYDVGCGAGFDTFALAARFGQVLGVDSARAAIREARRIARLAAVSNAEFRCADAETTRPPALFDLVWCNMMSHNVRSRTRLVTQLVSSLQSGGWLIYSEECEAYALREIGEAIRDRHLNALVTRIRQVVNGISGAPRFRFYLSGTIEHELSALGVMVERVEREEWCGMSTVSRVYGRAGVRDGCETLAARGEDPDYRALPPELAWARTHLIRLLSRQHGGLDVEEERRVRQLARTSEKRLAPLLLVGLMAEVCSRSLKQESSWEKVLDRLPDRFRDRDTDWGRLEELNDELVALLAGADTTMPRESNCGTEG
jgi:SAM-dependent methyltransferase